MAHDLQLVKGSKQEMYDGLFPQIKALIETESDKIANQANFIAAIREAFQFFWIGFYQVKGSELVLGPFQGPVACTRIAKGKGVCGTAWAEAKDILVPDVEKFPGHIACNSASRSELVCCVFNSEKSEVLAVLDIDSEFENHFDAIDERNVRHFLNEFSSYLF